MIKIPVLPLYSKNIFRINITCFSNRSILGYEQKSKPNTKKPFKHIRTKLSLQTMNPKNGSSNVKMVKKRPNHNVSEKVFKKITPAKAQEVNSFKDLNLNEVVSEGLAILLKESIDKLKPTEVQSLLIPEFLKRAKQIEYKTPILCAAETGSGKTLSFLLPIINLIKEKELLTKNEFVNKEIACPDAFIIAPSVELVDQIYDIAKQLSHTIKFRVLKATRHTKAKDLHSRLKAPIDIVVATPSSLVNLIENKTLKTKNIKYLIIDEADTLFDEKFEQETQHIITKVEKNKDGCQIVMTSATIPQSLYNKVTKRYSDVCFVVSKKVHKKVEQSEHMFVSIQKYQGNRNLALLDILRQYESRDADTKNTIDKILIFCNTQTSVENLSQYLTSREIKCMAFYSGINYNKKTKTAQNQEFKNFIYDHAYVKDNLNQSKIDEPVSLPPLIMICTDVASRGLDTVAVDHVINYDFPKSTIDYIHRAGRTARNSKSGIITSLIGLKDKKIAQETEECIKKNKPFA